MLNSQRGTFSETPCSYRWPTDVPSNSWSDYLCYHTQSLCVTFLSQLWSWKMSCFDIGCTAWNIPPPFSPHTHPWSGLEPDYNLTNPSTIDHDLTTKECVGCCLNVFSPVDCDLNSLLAVQVTIYRWKNILNKLLGHQKRCLCDLWFSNIACCSWKITS